MTQVDPTTHPVLPVPDALRMACIHGTRLPHRTYLADEATERNCGEHQTCWRWDSLTHLQDPLNPAFRAWYRGQHETALHLLHGEVPTLAARRQVHRELSLAVRILWAPQHPPTPYQQFRFHELRTHAVAGFDVCTVPTHLLQAFSPARRLPSLIVYPGRVVYLPHHTADGHTDGATRIRDPKLATTVADFVAGLAEYSTPLSPTGAGPEGEDSR